MKGLFLSTGRKNYLKRFTDSSDPEATDTTLLGNPKGLNVAALTEEDNVD